VRSVEDSVRIGLSSFIVGVSTDRLEPIRSLLGGVMLTVPEDTVERRGMQPGSVARHWVWLDFLDDVPFSVDKAYVELAPAEQLDLGIASAQLEIPVGKVALGKRLLLVEVSVQRL
jgi:hypothetical protein